MLPVEFFEFATGPRFAALSFLDSSGRPSMTRSAGYRLEGDKLRLVVLRSLAPEPPADGALGAVVMSEVERFVAYQVKGPLRTFALTPEDSERGAAMMAELGELVERTMGLPAALYKAVRVDEELGYGVEMEIREVFRQSPGPNAGSRVED